MSLLYKQQDAHFFKNTVYDVYLNEFLEIANKHLKNVASELEASARADVLIFFSKLIGCEKRRLDSARLAQVTFIEGNIGIGKSTFINEQKKMNIVDEPLRLWQSIDYTDPNGTVRSSFESFYHYLETHEPTNFIIWFELFAILTRVLILLDKWHSAGADTQLISERSFLTDRYIFLFYIWFNKKCQCFFFKICICTSFAA